MGEFDAICKFLMQNYSEDLIQFFLEQLALALRASKEDIEREDVGHEDVGQEDIERGDIEVIVPLNTELQATARHVDSLFRARIGNEEVLIHTEFQTDSDSDMPMRMAGYIIRAIEAHRLPVYSNVIYLRPGAGEGDPGKYTQKRLGYKIKIQYNVIQLSKIEGQPILDAGGSHGSDPLHNIDEAV